MKMLHKYNRRSVSGFTFLEVLMAVIIVGMGVVSLMMLFTVGTKVNKFGNDLATAVFLAEQVRGMTDEAEFDDLFDYDGQTYNGVDAAGDSLDGLNSYQQSVQVQAVNPADLSVYVGSDPEAVMITASVSQGASELTSISWIRIRY